MKKRLLFFCMLMVTTSAYAFITNYKTWVDGDILYSSDINGNFSKTNTALDSMATKSSVDDSVAAGIARDTTLLLKTAFNDSANVRLPSVILLPFSMAAGDSFYSGDSLTVEITRKSPLGDAAGLWIKNTTTKPEKIRLFWDVELPNALSKLDSIRSSVWSELTTGADFVSLYVLDDSTRYVFKVATDSTGSQYSATARTVKVFSQAVANSIVGGRIRVESIIQTNASDSMFVGPIELIVTNR